jgi:hypothetical protein
MTSQTTFTVPDGVTFEQAIALTQALFADIEQDKLTPTAIGTAVAALVSSRNGTRGFFVAYLTGESRLAEPPSEAVLTGLRAQPEEVADVLVKNLVMSTAMIITHTRNQNLDLAADSAQVQRRADRLIHTLNLAPVQARLQAFLTTLETGAGPDQAFLTRWGYDAEQQQSMQQALQKALT